MKRPVLAAGMILLTAGCYAIDIVSPAKNVPPSIVMSLSVLHVDETHYRLTAILIRGTDAEGMPRPFVDSLMLVNGEPVVPVSWNVMRDMEYAFDGSIPAGQADTLLVRLPIASGFESEQLLSFPVTARPDPYELELVAGTPLELRVPADAVAPPPATPGNWSLEVRTPTTSLVRLQGMTVPPGTLTLQPSLLPVAAGDTLRGMFSRSVDRPFTADVPYTVRAFEFITVQWLIPVVPAP